MASNTAADILIETIQDWGVEVVFGLPGDGINGIMEALRKRKDRVRFVQARHEEAAAFMACGYAKFTGRLGVCLATSGPGGIHLLNGLYDAKLDGQPVLAITGMAFHDLIGTHTQQDVALDRVFMDVAKYTDGRTHNQDHECSIMIGKPFKPSVIGGVWPSNKTLLQGAADYGCMPINSSNGMPSATGDVAPVETLSSWAKTVMTAVGVAPDQVTASITDTNAKVINGALA